MGLLFSSEVLVGIVRFFLQNCRMNSQKCQRALRKCSRVLEIHTQQDSIQQFIVHSYAQTWECGKQRIMPNAKRREMQKLVFSITVTQFKLTIYFIEKFCILNPACSSKPCYIEMYESQPTRLLIALLDLALGLPFGSIYSITTAQTEGKDII